MKRRIQKGVFANLNFVFMKSEMLTDNWEIHATEAICNLICSYCDTFEWKPYLRIFLWWSDLIFCASYKSYKEKEKIEQIH